MVSYYNDNWIAYLCEQIVRQTCQKSKGNCPGCVNKLNSPLLHLHKQLSLLDRIRQYFNEIRGLMLHDIATYYSTFCSKLPHTDDKKKDKLIYLNIARNFLLTVTPDSLYFGRYLDENNDSFINEAFTVKNVRKAYLVASPDYKPNFSSEY